MLDRWMKKLKLLYKNNSRHRKAIVRLMVVVVTCEVLSHCLGRAMTWHRKKVLVQTVSLILISVLLLGMIFYSGEGIGISQSRGEPTSQQTNLNLKENGNSSVHLELNASSVQRRELLEDNGQFEAITRQEDKLSSDELHSVTGENNRVVRSAVKREQGEGNVVVSQENEYGTSIYPMSLIQGTYEDHGQEMDIRKRTVKYQTPVDVISKNYDLEKESNCSVYAGGVVSGAATMIIASGSAVWIQKVDNGEDIANVVSNVAASGGGVSAEIRKSFGVPIPEINFSIDHEQKLSAMDYDIYCANSMRAVVCPMPGAIQYHCLYSGAYKVHFAQLAYPEFQLPNNFFGSVMVLARDEEDCTMAGGRKYYLIENSKPEITFLEGRGTCTAPYTLWVDVSDVGQMVSGIQRVSCRVNGKEYEIAAMEVAEYTSLGKSLKVPSKCYFPVDLQRAGTYDVEIEAVDYAGNATVKEKKIVVSEPELVSVYIQNQFKIHIDPQQKQKREKIYTDDILLANVSEFEVKVNIDNINLSVKDEKFSDCVKDCTIYLVAPDTGRKIKLSKGDNKMLYSFILSSKEAGKEEIFRFVGDITENSDEKWEDSDISIDIQMSFQKA